jgi:hypothetical protein
MIEVLSTRKPYKSLTLKNLLLASLECWSSIGVTSRKAQEKKGLVGGQKETQTEPKNKDSHYSKVMGQSMWPLPKK